jgi:hypothetical protein
LEYKIKCLTLRIQSYGKMDFESNLAKLDFGFLKLRFNLRKLRFRKLKRRVI